MPKPVQLNPQRKVGGSHSYAQSSKAARTGYNAPTTRPVARPKSPPSVGADSQNKGLGGQFPSPKAC